MFIKVNLNPKNKIVGDCVIRAISFIAKQPWDKTYTEICNKGFEIKDMPSANNVWGSYLKDIGYKRYIIPNTCPDCYTVRDFCHDHRQGRYNYMPMDEYPRNSYRPARYSMDHNKQDRITDTLQNMLYNSNSDMERDIIERLMVKLG